ncbi:MAG: hypothetical protein HXY41_14870 [Chloroflexi bacterium]|nr:hypothetical protein [Chloroflexota bacterium]
MRKFILVAVIAVSSILALPVSRAESNVQILFVACENQAVMNFTGNMDAGYDIFYQVFSGAGGTGTALTSLRRVEVNGAYAFSETVAYNTGATVAFGSIASTRVVIALEGNSNSTTYETTVDDIQDGCSSPQNQVGTSVDVGSSVTTTTVTSGILSPFGGVLNPPAASGTPEPIVVIGPRQASFGRSQTPGVIFAECNQYIDRANPGILYDTDPIVIFWSWYAQTPELVQQHIDNAQYDVSLNGVSLQRVSKSAIEQRTRNYWVFYTANLGLLEPGYYRVIFHLTWAQPISDGYDDFGPGAPTSRVDSTCNFEIKRNPVGAAPIERYNTLYEPSPSP